MKPRAKQYENYREDLVIAEIRRRARRRNAIQNFLTTFVLIGGGLAGVGTIWGLFEIAAFYLGGGK